MISFPKLPRSTFLLPAPAGAPPSGPRGVPADRAMLGGMRERVAWVAIVLAEVRSGVMGAALPLRPELTYVAVVAAFRQSARLDRAGARPGLATLVVAVAVGWPLLRRRG